MGGKIVDYQTIAVGACGKIEEAVNRFCVEGVPAECGRYGNGHINDTFLLRTEDGGESHRYILQRMNTHVFQNPKGLMQNVSGVTAFLRNQIVKAGGDVQRETLTLIGTKAGEDYYIDSSGSWWRMYLFITDAKGYDTAENEEAFYQSAKAFGHFQRLLDQYPVSLLTETIPDFHNTPKRFEAFRRAVERDVCNRAEGVGREIAFVMDRKEEMSVVADKVNSGEIPRRVTHNDTKLNNVLLDSRTGQAVCVIDLDTVMPGTAVFDFGDSIRFGANTAEEDEKDLSRVSLSLPLYEAYTRGFLEGCAGSLTDEEIRMLPWGAKLMTLECGMRFLTDYLEGDNYFRIHRPEHNLDRARTQFALAADMERKWEEMEQAAESLRLRRSSGESVPVHQRE